MRDRSGSTDGDWRRLARLGGGFGVLVAGFVVLVAGSANVATRAIETVGLANGAARALGFATAAAIPPIVLLGVLASVEAESRYRRLALVGIGLATFGIVLGIGTSAGIGDPLVTGIYGTGIAMAVATLFSGVLESATSNRSTSARPTTGYRTDTAVDRTLPADGGTEDDDLEFFLDDE
ncbi:MAG: hypothetical protein ACOCSF_00850 [Halanaeroarchaeum sp.]